MARQKEKKRAVITDFTSPIFRPYALAIGQAALAWNDLHERLALLFERVLGTPSHNVALKIWHSSIQDRASREMLKSALDEIPFHWPRGYPNAQDDVKWLLDRIDELENARNVVIHSPLVTIRYSGQWRDGPDGAVPVEFKPRKIIPLAVLGHRRASQLMGLEVNVIDHVLWLRDTALVLRDHVVAMHDAFRGDQHRPRPWPGRPQLPVCPQKNTQRRKFSLEPRK